MILQRALQIDCNLLWSEDLISGQVYINVNLNNLFKS